MNLSLRLFYRNMQSWNSSRLCEQIFWINFLIGIKIFTAYCKEIFVCVCSLIRVIAAGLLNFWLQHESECSSVISAVYSVYRGRSLIWALLYVRICIEVALSAPTWNLWPVTTRGRRSDGPPPFPSPSSVLLPVRLCASCRCLNLPARIASS